MEQSDQMIGRTEGMRSYLTVIDATMVEEHINVLSRVSQIVGQPEYTARSSAKTSPICPTCKGAGYLRHDVPFGHPHFSTLTECMCHKKERTSREQQSLLQVSQLETLQRFQRASFDSFDCTRRGVEQAYRATVKFAARPKGWLVLTGPNGCGKTHLAVAIAKERLAEGERVLFQTTPDLLDHLRSAFAPSAEEVYDHLFTRLRDVDLLILDDLGAEQGTPWAREKLFQLCNYRYNAMLPMVVTSNRMHLEGIDQRIVSRLRDQELVTLLALNTAEDYRPTTHRARLTSTIVRRDAIACQQYICHKRLENRYTFALGCNIEALQKRV